MIIGEIWFLRKNDYRNNQIIFPQKMIIIEDIFSWKTKRNDYDYQP